MKQHFCIHGAYILIVLLVSKPFAVAVIPTVYNFQVGSSKQEMFLAQDEVYLKIEKGLTVQKWDGLLDPLIASAKILMGGYETALVQMPVPPDYAKWFAAKNMETKENNGKLSIAPVLYTNPPPLEVTNLSSNKGSNKEHPTYSNEFRRSESNRLIATADVLITESDRDKVSSLAIQTNAQGYREMGDGNHYYITYKNAFESLTRAQEMTNQGYNVTPVFEYSVQRMATVNDPLYTFQWHLKNTGSTSQGAKLTTGVDINVESAWDTTKGSGAAVAIVDDGVQITHEDLAANTSSIPHLNILTGGNNPAPTAPSGFPNNTDSHGTACAGVAAARGDNRIGVAGVAPLASLVGIKLFNSVAINDYLSPTTSAQVAQALKWQSNRIGVYSNSWGKFFSPIGAETSTALADGFTNGRNGLGNVFVFAAGNQSTLIAGSNDYANSPYVITVGAVGADGKYASYSSPGACVLLSAPGGDPADASAGIFTTDLTGTAGFNSTRINSTYVETSTNLNYTSTFGGGPLGRYFSDNFYYVGTSAAAPIVAGVAALIQSAKPSLNARDIRDILVQSATKIDSSDKLWEKNAANFNFHPYYGMGMVNAGAAVALANGYKTLGNLKSLSTPLVTPKLKIPVTFNGVDPAATYKFDLSEYPNYRIENVVLTYEIDSTSHGNFQHFQLIIQSPSGTRSSLNTTSQAITNENIDTDLYFLPVSGTACTNQFWGERTLGKKSSPNGQWRVTFKNPWLHPGTVNKIQLTFYGTEILEPASGYGILIPDKDARVNKNPGNTTIGLPKKPASGTTNKSLQLPVD